MLPDGRRRKINNDASKLMCAVGLGDLQRRLLADFRFRCGAIPGTQEIRTKIGHLGFWACVNYGDGIFCTISPGERHNYFGAQTQQVSAGRPLRCERKTDRSGRGKTRRVWNRRQTTSLRCTFPGMSLGVYTSQKTRWPPRTPFPCISVPCWRRCSEFGCALAVRTVQSRQRRARMPWETAQKPWEALPGAWTLCSAPSKRRRPRGACAIIFMFVQRLHQFATLKEIAEKIESGLANATELKHFLGQSCCEKYPDVEHFSSERHMLEKNFPMYSEKQNAVGR